ncbi:MAG: hypothetical protein ACRD8O_07060 [Bryobacteraceae bacterium]
MSNDQWQTLISGVELAVTVFGFSFVVYQIRQTNKAIRSTTHSALYAQLHDVSKIFLENHGLRTYFYEGTPIDPSHEHYLRALVIAEALADFFEHVHLQRENLPQAIWPYWVNYMNGMKNTSPLLKSYLDSKGQWYGGVLS